MAHVVCTHVPGRTLADFHSVEAIIGHQPEGRIMCVAGEADGALHVIDVWDSRARADRFATETLFPAMRHAGLGSVGDASYVQFDTEDIVLAGGPR